MLDQALKDQIRNLFQGLQNNYTFQLSLPESHASSGELSDLLEEVASCSEKVKCRKNVGRDLSFIILKNDQPLPIVFRAVPTGHEFTSLLLAILNADGIGKNLPDEVTLSRIKNLPGKIEVKSYISLSCTNCPDVVQALNVLSLYNTNIQHTIIDGSINQQEVENLNIQAVPTVYVNGSLLHVGRSSLGELLTRLEEFTGSTFIMEATTEKPYDVVVAGGGPAGISAAIYSARKGLRVALVADKIGGQVTETVGIENMISIARTTGSQLTGNLRNHLLDYPVDILENRSVERIELKDGKKILYTSLGEILSAPAFIIATGASWRRLNVPGEKDYIGSGVAFCAHCDGPFYKNKKVVVVGGGNSGLEAAIDLSSLASDVTVLEYMDELKGDKVLQNKLTTLTNVRVITGAQTLQVNGDGSKVTSLDFKHRNTGESEQLITDGVFVQIGLSANSRPFKDHVEVNRMGEILVDAHGRTNIPGIYAAGDVSVVPYKQIVIAMGEGAKAALTAFEDKIKGVI